MTEKSGYPCACCGFLTRSEEDFGTFEICPVCCWEDDDLQAFNPKHSGGANKVNLLTAKDNFFEFGAVAREYLGQVRLPLPEEIPPTS